MATPSPLAAAAPATSPPTAPLTAAASAANAKEAAKALKNDLATLKKQQDEEIKLLKVTAKEQGLSSKEISALVKQEQTANKTEYTAAKTAGSVTKDSSGYIASKVAVASDTTLSDKVKSVAQATDSRVQEGLKFVEDNNLTPPSSAKGVGTSVRGGYILSQASKADTPSEATQVAKNLGAKHPAETAKIAQDRPSSGGGCKTS